MTSACFQSDGTSPSLIDMLNNFVNELAMLKAVSFSILVDILSGPLAFDVSRFDR